MDRSQLFIGIDVQVRRGVPYCIMDETGVVVASEWVPADAAPQALRAVLERLGPERCIVAIDGPRMPLPAPRTWSFSRGKWTKTEGKRGRHCELVVKALALANPQWTPLRDKAPGWMELGFALFDAADESLATTEEVFPSASYRALELMRPEQLVSIPLDAMRPGPKDMLDAIVGAFTALCYHRGRGTAVGGGDGLGTIVLPTPVEDHPVLYWPAEETEGAEPAD